MSVNSRRTVSELAICGDFRAKRQPRREVALRRMNLSVCSLHPLCYDTLCTISSPSYVPHYDTLAEDGACTRKTARMKFCGSRKIERRQDRQSELAHSASPPEQTDSSIRACLGSPLSSFQSARSVRFRSTYRGKRRSHGDISPRGFSISEVWCRVRDSNPHSLAATSS